MTWKITTQIDGPQLKFTFFFYFFFSGMKRMGTVLGFELGASYLLSRHSTA
jgi:hypothetical protein